jgi:hypothetical protein
MANVINSNYEWGINKNNAKNLSPDQMSGLYSLSPQAGFGLDKYRPAPGPLSYQYPAQQPVNPGPNDYNWTNYADEQKPVDKIPIPNLNTGNKPNFDSYYPNESMLALKNWLSPQLAQGADQAMHARGLDYSGVGKYASDNALRQLNSSVPNYTPEQAVTHDLSGLYGDTIVNQMIRKGELPGTITPDQANYDFDPYILGNKNANGPAFAVKLEDTTGNGTWNETLPGPGYWYNPDNPGTKAWGAGGGGLRVT